MARAGTGSGDDQVGFDCPGEGRCALPTSFDVATDGTVWLADPANHRLLRWTAGQPDAPSEAIHLDFAPIDVAIAPNGTLYVSGVLPGDAVKGMRLYAFDPDGRQRWMSRLLSEYFNLHIRMGPDGILYATDPGPGRRNVWVPAVDADGRPLDRDEQARAVEPDQPLIRPWRLVVSESGDCQVAVAAAGKPEWSWRIPSADNLILSDEAVPATLAGDLVLVFDVYKFDDHLLERLILRLTPDGAVAKKPTLGRGSYRGGDTVTDVRIGGDGRLYQLGIDPAWGMRLARYP